jgi:hypothetical protein
MPFEEKRETYANLRDEVSDQDREDGATDRGTARHDAVHSRSSTMPPVTDDATAGTADRNQLGSR